MGMQYTDTQINIMPIKHETGRYTNNEKFEPRDVMVLLYTFDVLLLSVTHYQKYSKIHSTKTFSGFETITINLFLSILV